MLDNLVYLFLRIAESGQGLRYGVVADLYHATSHEPLVLHQCNVRLDAGGVAVHHERYCPGWSDDGDLTVLETKALSEGKCVIPRLDGRVEEVVWYSFLWNLVRLGSVHVYYVEEWFLVGRVALECSEPFRDQARHGICAPGH